MSPVSRTMIDLGVGGVRAGHWTGDGTGVTVVLLPAGTVGSGEVRGGAPATREISLLEPGRTVARVDAVCFTGGSAFGLAAADGVMRYLANRGQGYPTAAGPVPIVPTAAVFDLTEGSQPPGPAAGEAAAEAAARGGPIAIGLLGAGAGATVGKWRGGRFGVPGGLGAARRSAEGVSIAAIVVVNAVGDVIDDDGSTLAGSVAPDSEQPFSDGSVFESLPGAMDAGAGGEGLRGNTTLVLLVTDARLDKHECRLLAESAHDGIARSLRPAHTRFDGDLCIAAATGVLDAHVDRLRVEAAGVVADAVRSPFRAKRQRR